MFFVFLLAIIYFLIPYLYIRYTTPIFETKATLIKKKEIKNGILDEKNTEFLKSNDEEKINRDIQIIKSDFLLNRIVDSINLNITYLKKGRIPSKRFELVPNTFFEITQYQIINPELFNREIHLDFLNANTVDISYEINENKIHVNQFNIRSPFSNKDLRFQINIRDKKINGEYIFTINDIDYRKNYVIENLQVTNATPNILFSIKSSNSTKSEFILTKVIEGFLALDQRENSEKIENSINYIKGYIDTINAQLRNSQLEKAHYIQKNAIYDPSSQLQSNLLEIESYHQKIDELDAKLYSIQKMKSMVNLESALKVDNYVGSDAALAALINERNKLLMDYTTSHPTIGAVNRQISERLTSLNKGLKLEIEDYQNRMNQMRNRKSQAQSNLTSLPERDMEFNKLQKEVEIKEKYVIDLIEKQIQYLIIKSSISSDYLVIQPPKTSAEQIYPRKSMLYSLTFICFLMFSFLIILYRYITYDRIISLDEVKKKTNVPILGYIPFVEEAHDDVNAARNSPESRIVVLKNPKSRTSEIFKKMRASMKYTSHSDYKTIAITSTISGEGKTFALINLAAVHALTEKKVLIIDLDMRKPRISKSFKLPNRIGMSNLLSDNTVAIEDCIQKNIEIANLDVITSGPIPPNPSELIISDRFDLILNELKEKYDYIFIDTPPVGLVNESIEIVNKVDIPLYLIKFNYSKKDFFNTLNETNKLKKNETLYLVINYFGDGASSYVNYNYGGYSYGYGYNSSDYHKNTEGYYVHDQKNKKEHWSRKLGRFFDWNL